MHPNTTTGRRQLVLFLFVIAAGHLETNDSIGLKPQDLPE
jgi:hypothetical protein